LIIHANEWASVSKSFIACVEGFGFPNLCFFHKNPYLQLLMFKLVEYICGGQDHELCSNHELELFQGFKVYPLLWRGAVKHRLWGSANCFILTYCENQILSSGPSLSFQCFRFCSDLRRPDNNSGSHSKLGVKSSWSVDETHAMAKVLNHWITDQLCMLLCHQKRSINDNW